MRKIYLALLLLTTGLLMTGKSYAQPAISYTPVVASCVNGDLVVNGVTITDAVGVPTVGALMPRLYAKKNSGAWVSAAGTLTSGSGTSGTWDFTVTAAALGGLVNGNSVAYFIVAENTASAIDANPGAGFSATDVNNIITPPTTPNQYTVKPLPSLNSLTSSPNTTCVGLPFTLLAGSVSGVGTLVSYNWTGPNAFNTTTSTSSTSVTPMTTLASGSYSLTVTYPGAGCTTNPRTTTVVVNGAMPAVTGAAALCVGSATSFTIATTGGAWYSSNPSVATISTSTGLATGVATGTTTITYLKGTCYSTAVLSVNPLPVPITGSPNVCVGSTTTLANATVGGNWSSSSPGVASVVPGTGDVSGVSNGTATITYTLTGTGCYKTHLVSVNLVPAAISGSLTVCEGATTNLTNAVTGGTWSSSNTSVATAGLASGSIAGVAAGTADISYIIGGSGGCVAVATVTVNSVPAPITGTTSVCRGFTTPLSNLTPLGTWSVDNPVIATISGSGVVTGLIPSSTTVSYTLPSGCASTVIVNVNTTPSAIALPHTICVGSNRDFNSLPTGTWSSSNVGVASIVSPAGVATGVSIGTTIISNILSNGCYSIATVTVNATPPAITGTNSVCTGATTSLSNAMPGGIWSTTGTTVLSVNPSTGLVTGLSGGTVQVQYSFPTGCATNIWVSVNPVPSISGGVSACEGGLATVTSLSVGTWSSSNPAVATVGSASGTVSALVGGTTLISFTTGFGCIASRTFTVNANPAPITGTFSTCVGSSTLLGNASTGGVWSSSATSIASVNSVTGNVTGLQAGTATISYRFITGCYSIATVTINAIPATIVGNSAVCLGSTTLFSTASTGGGWSTSNAAIASVDLLGLVSGNGLGTAFIYYTSASGCVTSKVVTVNDVPAAIGGSLNACTDASIALTNSYLGGSWISGNTLVASVSAFGIVTGISAGTTDITYKLGTGCQVTAIVTVNASPTPITGTTNACVGSTSLLSNATPGGTWSSNNVVRAPVDISTGIVSGDAVGTATIYYTLSNGCKSSTVFTVNTLPSPITGTMVICQAQTTTLSSTPTGGSWSTANAGIATVSSSGIVTGIGAGVTTISYTLSTGCIRVTDVTVNAVPPASTGVTNACIGSTTTLSNATPGGTWTSSNITVATVGATTGIITGVGAGLANITYTLTTGCKHVTNVVINTLPAAISGNANVCQGLSTTLSNTITGGTWSSGTPGVAIIGSGSGVVVGVGTGTSVITYMMTATGCFRTQIVTVNAVPAPITGGSNACIGNSITLSSATLGGTWISSNVAVATIGNFTGVVTGITSGAVNITYKMSTGCYVTTPVTVNLLPAALAGSSSVCVGATTVFTSATPGGTWSSGNIGIATVGTNGVITGASPGVAFISYTLSTGCFVTRTVTVNGLPSAIAGTTSLCQGANGSLTSLTPGGTWSSSSPSTATVGATNGYLTALFPGITTITYTSTTGCTTTVDVTVNSIPSAITGTTNICLGMSSPLTSLTPGGSWSTSNPVVATIGAGTGILNGITVGSATITYIMPTGCRITTAVSVSPVPADILGVPSVCVGSNTNLFDLTPGGAWSSTDNTVATVSSSGVVSGISAGTAIISYTMLSGCGKAALVTVNQIPGAIVETAAVCVGSSMTLTSPTPGGIWTSSVPARAIIDVTTGLLSGITAGNSTITYALATGCKTYTIATVSAVPTGITGPLYICSGSTSTLHNGVSGGIWTSNNIAVATIDPGTGVLTGTATTYDTVTIKYTVAGGCIATAVATVTGAPPAITGNLTICAGTTTLLTNTSPGGTWTSSNSSVATIDLGSGLVTAYGAGTTNITYTLGIGCQVTTAFVVNAAPTPIIGPSEVCMGHSVTLYNGVSGGSWTSSDVSVASVDIVTGIVTGIANNPVDITYTLPGGCAATFTMTVHSTPPPIGGADSVCYGLTTTLTNASPFTGIWTSSDPSIAPVGLTSGVVSGVAVGTSTVKFTILGTGCFRETVVTVNPTPGPLTGTTYACVGSFTVLTPTSTGGVWSSSNLGVAVVGSVTGIVNGLSAGGVTISYTLPTTCLATAFVVINPLPAPIVGTTQICMGSSTIFTNATPFGTWSSNNTSIATIDPVTGNATAVSPGIATISYTLLATGCYITQQITVDPIPPSIDGTPYMCIGATTFLSNPLAGGVWNSSNPLVATIDPFGNVTSTGTGTTTITYTLSSACYITRLVTVEPTLNPITGPTNVCEGSSQPFSNDYIGGIWSTSSVTIATVGTTGILLGVSPGAVTLSYKTPVASCLVTKLVTIDPLPTAIVGIDSVCVGGTRSYSTLSAPGVWSTTDATLATITTGGVLTGVSAGVVTVSYTISTGCASTLDVRVKALANAGTISGPSEVCLHDNITLTTSGSEGVWVSSDATIASIGTAGDVHAGGVGTVTISYISHNDCSDDTSTFVLLVKPAAFAGVLSGNPSLCINYSSPLTSTVSGGVWVSSNTAVATVSASGVVSAIVAGTSTISYSVTTSCGTNTATMVVTVNVMAPHTNIAIHPKSSLCANLQFQNFGAETAPGPGLNYGWTAENAEIYAMSADRQNAVVNFGGAGTAVVRLITMITNTGCFVTDSFVVTVNNSPAYTPEVKYFNNELICTDNTSSSYQWGYDDANSLDSTLIPGAIQQSFYLPVPDFGGKRYWVIAERDGCFQKVYYNKPTDVAPVQVGVVNVKLFPNPTSSSLNIEVTGITSSDDVSIRLVDMLGKELESSVLVNGKGNVNVTNLPAGVYSVIFINNGVKVTSKTFVKN